MQHTTSRILSLLLALVMVLSMVPTVFAAEDSASVTYVAENTATGVQYENLDTAIADAQAGQIVKALADAENVTYGNEGVILDLNGHDLTVTAAEGVTLSAIDSATDDYEGEYGSLITDGTVATTVKTAEPKSYVAIHEGGSYSFHRYYAAIAAISLKPTQVALGYRAEFRGDEAVKNAVTGYGYEMWLNGGAHKAYSRTDALEKSSLTLRLKNIMAQGNDTLNTIGSTATIGGNAFITLNLGGEEVKLYGTEQETTLRQVVESVNANAADYGQAQLESVRTMITTYAPWMEGWATEAIFGSGESEGDSSGLDVEITVDVTAENGVLTQDATLSNEDITVTVPQGTVLEEGTTQLVLTITEKASSDSDVTAEEDETLIPLDVHIEGISESNTTPILVCLGQILPKGLNIGNYALYHVENGQTVEMTHVLTLDELDTHNEFHYDPATGSVTVAMASFSEVTLKSDNANVWNGNFQNFQGAGTAEDPYIIANADQLAQMSVLVSTNETYAGANYKLISDLNFGGPENAEDENGAKYVFYPIGYWAPQDGTNSADEKWYDHGYNFTGVFDGNGNTISGIYQNTWLMNGDYDNGYYNAAMGLFGAVYNATIKNLTIDSFASDGEFAPTGCVAAYAGGNSVFENITLTNCNPRVYNTSNGGIVGLNYNSTTAGKQDALTFRNITVDQTNKITALWGSWDVGCGGILGRLRDDETNTSELNTATFENCHVSAIIDVYNDVCANYQYYQYRYCGMLIGTVDYVDLASFDLSTVITASNTTVTYGDWNEYWYCELVANSPASYTHDYQFSRLEKISDVSDIRDAEGNWTSAGNFVIPNEDNTAATCYHIYKDENGNLYQHNHSDEGTQEIDGETIAVEDRVCYYIPFGQLFTGYGWGSSMRDAFDGITLGDSATVKSQEKFTAKTVESWIPGETKSLSDLFEAKVDETKISKSTLQVFVSPADENSTVSGEYNADTGTWQDGTLTITGTGKAKITITDYFYCTNTTLIVNVAEAALPVVSFNVPEGVAAVSSLTGTEITLPTAGNYTDDKEYTFAGWYTSLNIEGIEESDILKADTAYAVTEDTTLYAVYSYTTEGTTTEGTTSYEKVTEAPDDWSGTYLIIYEEGNVAFNGELTSLDAVSNTISVTISDNKIEATDATNAAAFTIETSNTSYTIKSASGYYIGATGNSNSLNSHKTTVYTNTLSMNDDGSVNVVGSGGAYLRFNATNNQMRFRYYKSSSYNNQKAIALYKYTETAAEGEGETYYVTFAPACEHSNTTTVTTDATCTEAGSTVVSCVDCGAEISNTPIAALGHDLVAGETVAHSCTEDGYTVYDCSRCDHTENGDIVSATGHNYDENDVCSVCGTEKSTGVLVTDITKITIGGGFVIAAKSGDKYYAMDTTIEGKIAAIEVTVTDGVLDTTSNVPVWNVIASGEGIALKNETQYLKWSSGTSFGYDADPYVWKIAASNTENAFNITPNGASTRQIALNSDPEFGTYATSNSGYIFDLYLFAVDPCDHINAITTTVNATCTADGYTQVSCTDCNRSWISSETPALGHSTDTGLCANCGEMLATLSFASTDQRTSFSTETQVWEQNGITFTNNKSTSTTNVADYSNPVRLYANSEVIIAFTNNVNSIEFVCTEGVTDLVDSIDIEGATVTISGNTVIVTLVGTSDTITIARLVAQIRLTSITVTYSTES